ncbi:hypothetical protein AJO04nite_24140 [Acinetobacter johnsonii]|uniref:Transposase n=1 Tax=Acinetobacter johnsonii TaxID=40214 RepID=A0AAV3WHZ2_ACIJO|nr:hypothetical protein AJO04nite_24140 [Acinetobacter johnsonii]
MVFINRRLWPHIENNIKEEITGLKFMLSNNGLKYFLRLKSVPQSQSLTFLSMLHIK